MAGFGLRLGKWRQNTNGWTVPSLSQKTGPMAYAGSLRHIWLSQQAWKKLFEDPSWGKTKAQAGIEYLGDINEKDNVFVSERDTFFLKTPDKKFIEFNTQPTDSVNSKSANIVVLDIFNENDMIGKKLKEWYKDIPI